MGNAQSPPADPRFTSAARAFTQHKLDDLKSFFTSLAAQSNSNGEYVSLSVFQEYFGLKGPLGKRLFDLVTRKRKDDKLSFEDLVIAKSVYEKGTRDEMDEFVYQLLDLTDDGFVGRSDVESVIIAILKSVFSLNVNQDEWSSCEDVVNMFVNAATFSKDVEGSAEKSMSFEDFRTWCCLLPSVRKFLGSLLTPPDAGRPGSQIPELICGENFDPKMILLRKEFAWHIGGALPQHELEEWKLLYNSAVSGQSFNTFLGSISNGDGPTVLIVKDKEDCIYGGYASQPWERHGDFYGDMKSFLFQLCPKASIFKPTGANNNVQWCAANFTSESIPNGIGFGGRANHFGLFLSASFDTGHSFACTTFGSPSLSKSTKFIPEAIECWGIVHKGGKQEKHGGPKGTVLERFKEDRNMLNLVGLANSSD
ncbi:TLD-domain containing nucleolar protein [Euphorbia peplus]|nr:TLD-domain containing nucleolar protein [Euphorbia peplus]